MRYGLFVPVIQESSNGLRKTTTHPHPHVLKDQASGTPVLTIPPPFSTFLYSFWLYRRVCSLWCPPRSTLTFLWPPTATHSLTVYMTRPVSAWTLTLWPVDNIDLQVQFTVLVPRWQLVNPQQPAASLSPQMAQRAPTPPTLHPKREPKPELYIFSMKLVTVGNPMCAGP